MKRLLLISISFLVAIGFIIMAMLWSQSHTISPPHTPLHSGDTGIRYHSPETVFIGPGTFDVHYLNYAVTLPPNWSVQRTYLPPAENSLMPEESYELVSKDIKIEVDPFGQDYKHDVPISTSTANHLVIDGHEALWSEYDTNADGHAYIIINVNSRGFIMLNPRITISVSSNIETHYAEIKSILNSITFEDYNPD